MANRHGLPDNLDLGFATASEPQAEDPGAKQVGHYDDVSSVVGRTNSADDTLITTNHHDTPQSPQPEISFLLQDAKPVNLPKNAQVAFPIALEVGLAQTHLHTSGKENVNHVLGFVRPDGSIALKTRGDISVYLVTENVRQSGDIEVADISRTAEPKDGKPLPNLIHIAMRTAAKRELGIAANDKIGADHPQKEALSKKTAELIRDRGDNIKYSLLIAPKNMSKSTAIESIRNLESALDGMNTPNAIINDDGGMYLHNLTMGPRRSGQPIAFTQISTPEREATQLTKSYHNLQQHIDESMPEHIKNPPPAPKKPTAPKTHKIPPVQRQQEEAEVQLPMGIAIPSHQIPMGVAVPPQDIPMGIAVPTEPANTTPPPLPFIDEPPICNPPAIPAGTATSTPYQGTVLPPPPEQRAPATPPPLPSKRNQPDDAVTSMKVSRNNGPIQSPHQS